MLKEIGKNIKTQREKLNLSVEDVSSKIDVGTKNIYKIEAGDRIGASFVKYILFLKSKGVDLNKVFNISK